MENKNTGQKRTSAIYMTAAFLSKGAKLVDIDKTDPKHMIFTIELPIPEKATVPEIEKAIDHQNLDAWEHAWVNETLEVNAVRFTEAIQRLKSVIHSSDYTVKVS